MNDASTSLAPQVRAALPADLPSLRRLRRSALETDPISFGATPDDDRLLRADYDAADLNRIDATATLGAWLGDDLVGMVGLYRHQGTKFSHKLQLWGMYVAPAARGHGVGNALLRAALATARRFSDAWYLNLCVHRESEAAWRLYARHGFVEWGVEPGGFRHDGRLIDDRHLSLRL